LVSQGSGSNRFCFYYLAKAIRSKYPTELIFQL
jgi:hypothetical protein